MILLFCLHSWEVSLNEIAQAQLWSQGCWVLDHARLTCCQGSVWAGHSAATGWCNEVELPLADPSLCSASFRVHWFKQNAWKKSAQPFLWAWASSPDCPHLSSVAGWVRSSTRWLWGWSRAEEVVIWTYCQSLSFDSNRDLHQCEMGGDFPDLFWGFLFPTTMLAGAWGRVECLLCLSLCW